MTQRGSCRKNKKYERYKVDSNCFDKKREDLLKEIVRIDSFLITGSKSKSDRYCCVHK